MKKHRFELLSGMLFLLFCVLPSFATQYGTVTDGLCTAALQCGGISGHECVAAANTITMPSNGTYYLTASIDNCDGHTACYSCLSEAYLYDGTTLVGCSHNQCGSSCDKVTVPVTLSANTAYTLYCCKIDCSDDDCSNCGASCLARATLGDGQ